MVTNVINDFTFSPKNLEKFTSITSATIARIVDCHVMLLWLR